MKKLFLILLILTGFAVQSQTLIKSVWMPADKDSASVVKIKAPMVYETIQRFVWKQRGDLIEKQCRAYLKFDVLLNAPDTDTTILFHLFRTWRSEVYGVEVHDYFKIVDLYEYQIQFTK